MKPEQIVTTLETSKRLKELGVKQGSCFYYGVNSHDLKTISLSQNPDDRDIILSAFTAEEIGEMLPESVNGFELNIHKEHNNDWYVAYRRPNPLFSSDFVTVDNGKSLAEAMALTYIQLKEKGII